MLKPILVSAVVLSAVSAGLWFANESSAPASPMTGKPLLERLPTEELSRIRIEGQNRMELIRSGGQWLLASEQFPVDVNSLSETLLKLTELKVGDRVTDNPERLAMFHLEAPPESNWEEGRHATRLVLLNQGGEPLLELLLGKNRENADGQYFRPANSNSVYLLPEKLPINSDPQEWLEKKLLDLPQNAFRRLTWTSATEEPIELTRDAAGEWTWSGAEDVKLNATTVRNAVGALAELEFAALLPQAEGPSEAFDNQTTVQAILEDGRSLELRLSGIPRDGGDHAFQVSFSATSDNATLRQAFESLGQQTQGRTFTLRSWDANDLLISGKDLQE